MSALDSAVFWTEYVIRHQGAPHMHYNGANLNFIQKNSLDVIGLIAAILYVVFKVIKLLFKFIMSLCCPSKKLDKNLQKKKRN